MDASSFVSDSFLSILGNNCTHARKSGHMEGSIIHGPLILAPVSALTITRTSFGSFASTTANLSPPAKLQNPVVLATTPVHSQDYFGSTHIENASPKLVTSQATHSASDPPPLPASIPTFVPKPQAAGPKQQSIQDNADEPGNVDSNL